MTSSGILISEDDFQRLKAMLRARRQCSTRLGDLNALERELRWAQIVPTRHVPHDVVTMNTTARVRDIECGWREVLTVVYPHEAGGACGTVSVLNPLGKAILGVRVDDVVPARTDQCLRPLEVEMVLYQPEAARDLHL